MIAKSVLIFLLQNENERFVHETIAECELCKKTFSNKQKLTKQKKSVHMKEVMSLICDVCNKQFEEYFEEVKHSLQFLPTEKRISI